MHKQFELFLKRVVENLLLHCYDMGLGLLLISGKHITHTLEVFRKQFHADLSLIVIDKLEHIHLEFIYSIITSVFVLLAWA